MLKWRRNLEKQHQKPIEIYQTSFQNRPKYDPRSKEMRPWSVFGAKLRPGRLKEGSPGSPSKSLSALLAENVAPRIGFGTVGESKIGKKFYL